MGTGRITVATSVVASVLVAVLVAGCSSSGDDPGESAVRLTFAPDVEVTLDDLERAVAVVERRIEALDVDAAVAADADERTVVVGLDDDDPAVADEVTGAVEAPGDLHFRPVLAVNPTGATELTPPAADRHYAAVTLADDEDVVYSLGPSEGTGAMVESAEARVDDTTGRWEVALVFLPRGEGIYLFNAIADRCANADPTCPTSQLAVVLDSVVQWAPKIMQPSFERDQVVIAGDFDAEDAAHLAAVLEAGALPFALTLRP